MVLVLGDVGRSPRMQYHALSLASTAGMHVDLIGYAGATPHENILSNDKIKLHLMKPLQWRLPRALFLIYAPIKVTYQITQLMWTLMFSASRPHYILVQNPPAIPTLLVVHLVSILRCSHLVIDWHNFGYTLMGINLGERHLLTRISYWYERVLGRGAYGNFCVTEAMRDWLRDHWGITPTVLYDRPADFFRDYSIEEHHDLFVRLHAEGALKECERKDETYNDTLTLFTEQKSQSSTAHMRPDRPALVVSSTSWTADEDFQILLDAVIECEQSFAAQGKSASPRMVVIITGKGPMKDYYMKKIAALELKFCRVLTAWLAAEDYPRLLGAADLGISLHTSSSGLDLPMKVVDMYGCRLPVCAIGFPCLHELVHHNENGMVFADEQELSEQMMELIGNFPADTKKLDSFRQELKTFQQLRWTESWTNCALPIFTADRSNAHHNHQDDQGKKNN
jgi:beta-1,4-mannosyltransferase